MTQTFSRTCCSKFEVLQHVRHKYACKHCGDGKCATCDGRAHIDIATKEAQPIEGDELKVTRTFSSPSRGA